MKRPDEYFVSIIELSKKIMMHNPKIFLQGSETEPPVWFMNILESMPLAKEYVMSFIVPEITLNLYSEDISKLRQGFTKQEIASLKLRTFYNLMVVSAEPVVNFYSRMLSEPAQISRNSQKISIIMPVLNNWELTKQALYSILETTDYPDWELIIVDNGSTDMTMYMLPEIVERFDNIRMLRHKSNIGFSAGNNSGVDLAEGDYLLFLNNDIQVQRSDWLSMMAEVLDYYPLIGATGQMANIDIATPEDVKWIQAIHLPWVIVPVSWISGYCLMVKRKAYKDAGGWRGDLYGKAGYEDIHFGYALNRAGWLCVSMDRYPQIIHLIKKTRDNEEVKNVLKVDEPSAEDKVRRFEDCFGRRNYHIPALFIPPRKINFNNL